MALALTADMDLATNVAARSDEDPLRQRHLWIAIARHVISRPAPEVCRPAAAWQQLLAPEAACHGK